MMENEAETTKKKIEEHKKDNHGLCRLCDKEVLSKHLSQVFSKAGINKSIQKKIFTTTGVIIAKHDVWSQSVCRGCVAFVEKMWEFREKCEKNETELRKKCSVKRLPQSPLVKENKFVFLENETLQSDITNSSKQHYITPINTTNNITTKNITPVNITKQNISHNIYKNQNITQTQIKILPKINFNISSSNNTISNAPFSNNTCTKESTNLISNENRTLQDTLNDLWKSCDKLAKRKNSSLLLNHSYEGLRDFNFVELWEEIQINHPLFINVMKVMCIKNIQDDISEEIKIKICFIYSILMQTRWHELSLLQRTNTVLLIEGGCSKKVRHLIFIFF